MSFDDFTPNHPPLLTKEQGDSLWKSHLDAARGIEPPFHWVERKPGLFTSRRPIYFLLIAIIGGGVLALVL